MHIYSINLKSKVFFSFFLLISLGFCFASEQEESKSVLKNMKSMGYNFIFGNNKNKKIDNPFSSFDTEIEYKEEDINFALLRRGFSALNQDCLKRKDKSVNLIVGPTRSGKSTSIAYLLGADLSIGKTEQKIMIEDNNKKTSFRSDKYENVVFINNLDSVQCKSCINLKKQQSIDSFLKCTCPYPAIGHGGVSKTMLPRIYPLNQPEKGFNYCDTEGTEGSKNSAERKLLSLFMPYMLLKMDKVKSIILCVSYSDLKSKGGRSFAYCTDFITKYLGNMNYDTLQSSLFVGVTQLPSIDFKPIKKVSEQLRRTLLLAKVNKDEIDGIVKETAKSTIQELAKKQRSKTEVDIAESFKNAFGIIAKEFFTDKGNMQVGRKKELFELFFYGKVTKKNVRNLNVKMNKFLLIDPVDGGFSKKLIEEKLAKAKGVDASSLPTFDNPLSIFFKEKMFIPICQSYLIQKNLRDFEKQNNTLVQIFNEEYEENNPYHEKNTKLSKNESLFSGLVGVCAGIVAGVFTLNPGVGIGVGVAVAGTVGGSIKGDKVLDEHWHGKLKKNIVYNGEEGPIQKIQIVYNKPTGSEVMIVSPPEKEIKKSFKGYISRIGTDRNETVTFGYLDNNTNQKTKNEKDMLPGYKGEVHIQYVSGLKQHGRCSVKLYVLASNHSTSLKEIEKLRKEFNKTDQIQIGPDEIGIIESYSGYFLGNDTKSIKAAKICINDYNNKELNKKHTDFLPNEGEEETKEGE